MFTLNRETVQCRCITVPHIVCPQLIIFCQIIMILINEANDTYSYICTGVFECPRHTGVPSKCVWNTRVSTRKARESDTTKPKGVLTGFWRWSKICNTKACEIHNIFWLTLLYMTACTSNLGLPLLSARLHKLISPWSVKQRHWSIFVHFVSSLPE